jgi:CelD/BcsL family acetyltransferase involved in cellulose biosynthesis
MQQEFRSLESTFAGTRGDAVAGPVRSVRVDDVVISVHTEVSAIEQIWREFERRTPISIYQRFDWILPWCNHAAPSLKIEPTVVLGSRHGRPVFLLPFGRQKTRLGVEISWLGCSHVNIGLGLFDPDFAAGLDEPLTRQLFARVVEALAPADLMVLHNQPADWNGGANPMRYLGGRAEDQPVLAIPLRTEFEAMVNARKRKKLRWQENALASVGGYRFFRAEDRSQANAIFDTFLAQKEQQFAKLGIDNIFADAGTETFFRRLIAQSLGKPEPAIELFGLEIDGAIRATFGAGIHRGRVYGYFSGINLDEYQRVSPGELLLYHLVRDCCERGYEVLDLGVGEERYKAAWSPVREHQFATFLPMSMRGRLFASCLEAAHVIKVRIRRSETAWKLAKRMRQLKARMRPKRAA